MTTTLTRDALSRRIAETTDLPLSSVDQVIKSFLGAISLAVASGETVDLHQFGSFARVKVAERTGRDPVSGEPMQIAAHSRVKFQPYKALRAAGRGGA